MYLLRVVQFLLNLMIDITILPYLQSLTANLQNDSTYFSVLWVDYR